MCFGCCSRLEDKCGSSPKLDIPVDLEILALIENESDDQEIQDRCDNLEHQCVHEGKVETLKYLLKDEKRSLYRRGKRSDLFYYDLFRGLICMIVKNKFPHDVITLFVNTVKSELTYPQAITLENIGVIRTAESFELDLQTIAYYKFYRYLYESDGDKPKPEIEFLKSFLQREDREQLYKNQKELLSIAKNQSEEI